MAVDDVLAEPLAEERLGLAVVGDVRDELDDVEVELRQRRPHLVELVLRLDEDLVEPLARAQTPVPRSARKVPLAAPVAASAADPLIQHAPALELDAILELRHEVRQLRVAPFALSSCPTLNDTGTSVRVIGQRRLRHHDVMIAVGQTVDDLGRGLLAGEIEKNSSMYEY